jgi:hypothetical protein
LQFRVGQRSCHISDSILCRPYELACSTFDGETAWRSRRVLSIKYRINLDYHAPRQTRHVIAAKRGAGQRQ